MSDPNLLPPNATDLEKAIVSAFLNQLAQKDNVIRTLFNPNECPLAFLPYLASFLSVDFEPYNQADETKKRQMIAESIEIHRKKGTLGALEKALGTLDYQLDLREWYEYGGIPHTFTLDVITDTAQDRNQSLDLKLIRTVIDTNKNVQSAYRLNLVTNTYGVNYLGGGLSLKNKTILKGS